MEAVFSKFSTEVPDGWIDRSTVTFLVPPDDLLSDPRMMQSQQATSPGNVVINWVPSGGQDAASYIEEQARQLPALTAGFEVLDTDEKDGIHFIKTRIAAEQSIVQLILLKEIGDYFVITTGSVMESSFHKYEDVFFDIVNNLKERNS